MSSSNPLPPSIRALQATAILILTTAAGLSASLSFFVVPRLLESPTPTLIRQFARMLSAARRALPIPLVVIPALLHAFLAYRIPGKETRTLYATAAALSLSTLPYTGIVMMPINRMMLAKVKTIEAADVGAADVLVEEITANRAETAHVLADSWALRNLYRPAVSLMAGVIGLYAALS